MKNMYKMMLLAVGLLIVTANLSAQNRYTFGDRESRSTTIVTSDNMEIMQKDDNIGYFSFGKERKRPERANATMHTLTIITDGEDPGADAIVVASSSSENYLNAISLETTFTDIIEEGYYDIRAIDVFQGHTCVLVYDSIPVFEDVTINASFSECVYSIASINIIDETGQSLSGQLGADNVLYLGWSALSAVFMDYSPSAESLYNMRFSSCDERTYLCLNSNIYTTDYLSEQKFYNIIFPLHYGLSDDIVFENETGVFHRYYEKFHNNHGSSPNYRMLCKYSYEDGQVFFDNVFYDGVPHYFFIPDLPLTIISNRPSDDTKRPNILLSPQINELESYNSNGTWFYDFVNPAGLYYNNNDQLVQNQNFLLWGVNNQNILPNCLGQLGCFIETPITNVFDAETTLSFGDRTPMTYYQAYTLKADQLISGKNTFKPSVFSIGENGCERIGDKSAIATITFNGEEIFNDSLYKLPFYQEFQNEEAGDVTMVINNTHLTVDGVEKSNQAFINFNFNKEDVTAPTLTLLQVKDENGKESIELPNIAYSYINFAAGDFSPHYTEEGGWGHFDYMQYDGKPEIEVNYAITDPVTGNNWYSLEYTENEDMFHESYGNYFIIDLSQLPPEAAGKWISLEFVLADGVWNIMQQELSNVFYVGQLESINELSTPTHTVYPNPFSGEVKITAAQAVEGEANIAVYNVLGEQSYSKTENCTATKEFIIDGSTWKSGVYFYSICTEDGVLQGKIIKE